MYTQPDLLHSPVIIIIKSTLRAVRTLVKECFISSPRATTSPDYTVYSIHTYRGLLFSFAFTRYITLALFLTRQTLMYTPYSHTLDPSSVCISRPFLLLPDREKLKLTRGQCFIPLRSDLWLCFCCFHLWKNIRSRRERKGKKLSKC